MYTEYGSDKASNDDYLHKELIIPCYQNAFTTFINQIRSIMKPQVEPQIELLGTQ